MKVTINNRNGIVLKTKNKFCKEDIEVIPAFSGGSGESGGANVQLFAPTITLKANTLNISKENGDFAENYETYSNEELLATLDSNVVDLSTLLETEGVYEIKVKAKSSVLKDSEFSNTLSYTRRFGTAGIAYTLSSDGTYYICSGIGTATDTDIVIADIYNGLPVKEIAENAFKDNKTITSVVLQYPMEKINGSAFSGCSKIIKITLPYSINKSDSYAFSNTAISSVYIENLVDWCNIQFSQYNNSSSGLNSSNPLYNNAQLYVEDNLVNELIIPESVTVVKQMQFTGIKVPKIVITKNVNTIERNAFYNSTVTELVIEEGSNLTTIKDSAFANINATSITLPSTVTTIEKGAFTYCSLLESFTIKATTPPTLNGTILGGSTAIPIPNIYVPAQSVDVYKADTNWATYADKISAITE